MTSPVLEPKAPRRRRRSALKRQRLAVFITLGVVAVLVAAFVLVSYFTARIVFEDPVDGAKYYVVEKDGVFVMKDADGNLLATTEDGNFLTHARTIVGVDKDSGEPHVVAVVDTVGDETLEYSAYTGQFDILMYPLLERAGISSIELHNVSVTEDEEGNEQRTLNHFTFVRTDTGFQIKEYPDLSVDQNLLSTLIICAGYTNTYMRLDPSIYGYAEYGLPENTADAENYFVITDTSGKSHKVILGDETPPGTGRYARLEGREFVYVLKELEQTSYSATLTQALLAKPEDYITPIITTPMDSNNYFDVSKFELSQVAPITAEMLQDPDFNVESLMSSVISFDYDPIERRRNTLLANTPYIGNGKYEGFGIDSLSVDSCLQNIRDISAGRTVKVFTEEENKSGLFYFAQNYGIGYCLEFYHNTARDAKNDYKVTESYYQQVWISKRNESGSYYMYNEVFSMIVEVGRSSLEFLELDGFDWIENSYINGGIVFMEKMELYVPGGVSVNGQNKTNFSFVLDNAESLINFDTTGGDNIPSDKMKVWESGVAVDLIQFKLFYQTLLRSELGGLVSCSKTWQQACEQASGKQDQGYASDGVEPLLVIKITYKENYDGSGKTHERVYCFYPYETPGYQSVATFNGLGEFYMVSSRITKIISDLGKVFSGEKIDPSSKR